MFLFLIGTNVAISVLLGYVLVKKHTLHASRIHHRLPYLYLCLFVEPVCAFLASVAHVYWLFLTDIIIKENPTRSFSPFGSQIT